MSNKNKSATPRRHCMIVHAYYPLGETRVEREANALIDRGCEVDVICLRDKGEPGFETGNGVNIHRLSVARHMGSGLVVRLTEYFSFMVLVFLKLLILYPRRRYGVVQIHNLPDFLVFSAVLPKLFGARLILDLHDLMPEFFASSSNRSLESFHVRPVIWQEQLSCRFADRVITVTDLWRDKLINRGVPPDKVSVVMNVADDRIFFPLPATERPVTPKSPPNGSFHLIYHGTFKQRYGLDILIRSIALLRDDIPGIRLTIQGVGEYHQEMMRLVADLNLGNQVTISAYALHASELPALIRQADVGVVPNRNDLFTGELLPTKLLEYMALNVPAVAARTKAIASYFDESTVQFFRPGDVDSLAESILSLYRDPRRLRELAENTHKFNQMYDWQSVSKRYVALVHRLYGDDDAQHNASYRSSSSSERVS